MTPVNFSITFLGTSAASIFPNSLSSMVLVKVNKSLVLIDAGVGALRQLRKINVNPGDIKTILITHWHLDHYAGLPAILKSRRSTSNTFIYGPAISIVARVYLTTLFHPLDKMFEAVKDGFSQSYSEFHFQAIATSHKIDSYGWAITETVENQMYKERRVIISGDTRPTINIIRAAQGADLLVHEATYVNKDASTAILHQHSTAKEAAEVALESAVGALALIHIPSRYSRQEIQTEAQNIFPSTFIPSPLDTVQLEPSPKNEIKEKPGWARIRMEAGGLGRS